MGIRVNPDMYSVILNGLQMNAQARESSLAAGFLRAKAELPFRQSSCGRLPGDPADAVKLRHPIPAKYFLLDGVFECSGLGVEFCCGGLDDRAIRGSGGSGFNPQFTPNRQALAQQIQGIQQEILGLANTSYNGEYLFSGTATTTQPYAEDTSAASGVAYNGNDNTNSVEISAGQAMPISLPGSQLFSNATTNVFQSLQDLYNALTTNTDIPGAITEVQNALNYVSTQQTFYGNSVDRLNNAQTFLTQEQTQLTERPRHYARRRHGHGGHRPDSS